MDYFAGLDISMDQIHVCVLDREGVVVHERGDGARTTEKQPANLPLVLSAEPAGSSF